MLTSKETKKALKKAFDFSQSKVNKNGELLCDLLSLLKEVFFTLQNGLKNCFNQVMFVHGWLVGSFSCMMGIERKSVTSNMFTFSILQFEKKSWHEISWRLSCLQRKCQNS